MLRLILAILFAALGGTLLLHYLKNFCLKEKVKLHLDWDGVLERIFITGIALKAPDMWPIILLIITIRVLMCMTMGLCGARFSSWIFVPPYSKDRNQALLRKKYDLKPN